jgi:HrpA-like RNA helicase
MAPITLLNKGNLVARMGEKQSELDDKVPLNYIMDWVGKKLESKSASSMSDRVIVLLSKTGSGKSSSIAASLYLRHFKKYKSNIIITEPRVLTTIDIPRDISLIDNYKVPNKDGLSIELFRNLGYQTQDYVQKPKEKGILFSTTGILLQLLKNMPDEKFCKRYKFVIIDEAHDRSLDVDLVLLLMKRLIKRNLSNNPPFLILMSATLNVDQYCKYFDTKTVFEVNGQSKPIEVIYPQVDVPDIYTKTCDIVAQLDDYEKKNPNDAIEKGIRDMIVFMSASGPIKKMIRALEDLNKTLPRKILPISITSADISGGTDSYRLIMEDYRKLKVDVDGKTHPAYRRIIVSTNVAETGLTLDYLRYCVDTAMQFTNEFNHRHGVNIMMTKPTTSSMSLQRKGRVGRKHAGVFYPLFTEKTFKDMIVDNTPSIMVEDMTPHMLALFVNEPVSSFDKMPVYDMLTPPSDDCINYSLQRLYTLGAINPDATITKLGKMMNAFRKMNIESSKMILSGLVYGASIKELVCMACLMQIKKTDLLLDKRDTGVAPYDVGLLFDELYQISPTFDRSACDTANYNRLKAKLLIGCEMLELLLIYQRFTAKASSLSTGKLRKWCFSKSLNYTSLCKITEFIDEIYWGMLDQLKINPVRYETQNAELYQVLKRSGDINNTELIDAVITLKKCIYEGYKNNLLLWDKDANTYKTMSGLTVSVGSKLVSRLTYQKLGASFDQEQPKMLIYKELLTRQDTKSGRYAHEASIVSVMDGFVHVDLELIQS